MLILGSFDNDGSPVIKIKIAGDLGENEYSAVLDTGFTGFVAIPFGEMQTLGLTISGATSVMLGDGSVVENFVAEGIITIGSQADVGTIVLDNGSADILVGLDFLRQFRLGLVLTDTIVALYDAQETMGAITQFMALAPVGSPVPEPTFRASEQEQ